MEQNLTKLPELLLPWFEENKRDLPWRRNQDPYHVWLSEIMLQQTRVEAVKGYYSRFLEKLPTIAALANADDGALQKLWEGLGYYSRVRNLKKAAQVIMDCHNGVFPQTYEQVLSLPGVGAYTAGAICSICFGIKTPAVDGNVLRVMSRLLNDDTPIDQPAFRKHTYAILEAIYPDRAGDFTQALMELGATVCGPNKEPDCANCPCRTICKSSQMGTAASLPKKSPKRGRRVEEKTVFILSCDGAYALEKRPNTGLLAGLWQFPNVEGILDTNAAIAAVEIMGLKPRELYREVERKHIFTHIQWRMRGVYMEVTQKNDAFTWLNSAQILDQAALPTAFRLFWEEIDNV